MGTKNKPGKFDCYAKADPDEPMFVLLGRDATASETVRYWIHLRQMMHWRRTSARSAKLWARSR